MYKGVFFSIAGVMILLVSLLVSSCRSTAGCSKPLKGIETYQVTLAVSPYGDLNGEKIQKRLKEKLASFGRVVEEKIPLSEEMPVLFVSLEPKGSAIASTIRVLEKVKVLKNGCEFTSVIWSYPFRSGGEGFPVEIDGKVSFAERGSPTADEDPLNALLNAFAEDYRAANPKNDVTFLISH